MECAVVWKAKSGFLASLGMTIALTPCQEGVERCSHRGTRVKKAPASEGGRYKSRGYFTSKKGPRARASMPAQ